MLKQLNLIVVFLMMGGHLYAGEVPTDSVDFADEIKKVSASCVESTCQPPYMKKRVKKMDRELKKILKRIAYKQAQIWGDTILEGDYAAAGNTRLDRVVHLYKGNTVIGYQITYSEKAWETSNCAYDGIHDATLVGCTPGRIIESSYVSLDFRDYFYDEKTAALFKEFK